MYQKDVTQNIEPATANPSFLMEAARLQGEAAKSKAGAIIGAVEGVKQAYDTMKFMDMRQLETDSVALSQEFLRRNEQQAAAEEASAQQQQLQAFGPPDTSEAGVVSALADKAARLRDASGGGMSNEEYVSRIDALVRQGVGKYPGLASEIRRSIGQITGLPGADLWAAQQFVQERFSPKREPKPDALAAKFVEQDIKNIAQDLALPESQVYQAYQANPEQFKQWQQQSVEKRAITAQTQITKDQIANLQVASDSEADGLKPGIAALVQGSIADNVLGAVTVATTQGQFQSAIQGIMAGGTANMERVSMEASVWSQQMLAMAQEGKRNATLALNDFITRNPNVTPAKIAELQAFIEQQHKAEAERWGDKNGYVAMSLVLGKYGEKSRAVQAQMYDLTLKSLSQFPPFMIQQYMLRPDDLKKQHPDAFGVIDKRYKEAEALRGNLTNESKALETAIVLGVEQAKQTGGRIDLITSSDATTKKAVNDVVVGHSLSMLDKAITDGNLSQVDANLLRSGMAIAAGQGANATLIRDRLGDLKSKVDKITGTTRDELKASISASTVEAVTAINSIIEGVRNKYGRTVFFGVNDAGDLLPLREGPQYAGGRPPVGRAYTPDLAASEVQQKALPLLMNLVNMTYLVDGREKKVIAQQLADIINNGEPYSGFFSLEAKPTSERISPREMRGTISNAPVTNNAAPTGGDNWWER